MKQKIVTANPPFLDLQVLKVLEDLEDLRVIKEIVER
jgi:hypothetical protein